eukprot:GDKJ01015452.1.p1 GENE.GDKJ01015452.1~~GDKJ01015452.1.p1  ORF type:complete len:620 (-),score=136.12 GDKJ01015452.1:126-1955(-)
MNFLGLGGVEAPKKETDAVELKKTGSKKLKRHAPPGTIMQDRRFVVYCVLKGNRRQFLMTLKVSPPVLVINDDSGELEFLRLYPSICRSVTLSGNTATLYTQTSKIVFEFEGDNETQSFSDALAAMYGVLTVRADSIDSEGRFREFNRRKLNAAARVVVESSEDDKGDGVLSDEDDEKFDFDSGDEVTDAFKDLNLNDKKRHKAGCRIHSGISGVKCDCEVSRPTLLDDETSADQQNTSEAQSKLNAMYPVSIQGIAAVGEKLSLKDLGSNAKSTTPSSFEWFLSTNFGGDKPNFNFDNPVCTQSSYIPQQNACGRWILLVVRRKVTRGQTLIGVAVSKAQVGPVCPDPLTCRGIMRLLGVSNGVAETISANVFTLDFINLFSCAGRTVADSIRLKVQGMLLDNEDEEDVGDEEIAANASVRIEVRVTRQGLVFASRDPPAAFSLFWHEFKCERMGSASRIDEGVQKSNGDSSLIIETVVPFSKVKIRPNLMLGSMGERDVLFHYVVFQKLACGEGPSSETWQADLADNNFTTFQRMYSSLWRERPNWGTHIGAPPPQIQKILRELPKRQVDLAQRRTQKLKEEMLKTQREVTAKTRNRRVQDEEEEEE